MDGRTWRKGYDDAPNPRNAIIFDGDDTLWDTQPLYDRAKNEYMEYLRSLGLQTPDILERFAKVDRANVALFGFSRDRFPMSMVQTYRILCDLEHRTPNAGSEQEILAIGASVFHGRPMLYDDTVLVLEHLRAWYELFLFTKGDHGVQEARVDSSGLREFFRRVYVRPHKTPSDFADIVNREGMPPEAFWSVGNSPTSDINPALIAGMSCVLIARNTWSYEHAETVRPVPTVLTLTEAEHHVLLRDGRLATAETRS